MLATSLVCEDQDVSDNLSDDEQSLLRRVAEGHRQSFEKIFRLYHPRVYKFAVRMTRDHHLAEEVTCDTLHAVWTGASKFRWQSSVSTWILGIAYKRSLKSFRSNSRHTSRHDSDYALDTLEESGPGGNPETYANNELEGRRLMLALDTLSVDHRAVLELTAIGHSCAEIANIVGCPENTVKTRTFHARRNLRAALQE